MAINDYVYTQIKIYIFMYLTNLIRASSFVYCTIHVDLSFLFHTFSKFYIFFSIVTFFTSKTVTILSENKLRNVYHN